MYLSLVNEFDSKRRYRRVGASEKNGQRRVGAPICLRRTPQICQRNHQAVDAHKLHAARTGERK
jgi:superfamily I DNA and RNA helicase